MANQLIGQASRYLQQHAHNPVDWFPWGEAAFEKARTEDKPVFLSIGYSACHWCHVMAHESFEDQETATLLNDHFVSIKVDREERPDLDSIYMGAVQAMTGSGGWPMSVFITPDGTPFYGGTYFPKEPRYNMPSFTQLLQAIAEAWRERRDALTSRGQQVVGALQKQQAPDSGSSGASPTLDPDVVQQAYGALRQSFDARHGGWGSAPKFPQPMALEFLLRYHHTTSDRQALAMVTETLEAMARGGIYDQLGGGFHRYAVDANWLTPHFEKMLYDNAQLARVYLHAWQVTREPLFRAVVEETLDYVVRDMTSPEGGFYATQDADSDGEEGAFYTWTPGQLHDVLGESATALLDLYGVTPSGSFEGKNILTFRGTFEERRAGDAARLRLFEARSQRTLPGRDEKVITAWNGLMLAAFAEAARVFGVERYRVIAERNAAFLLRELRTPQGRLMHIHYGDEANVTGLLEDYAHLIEGLIALYQATFQPHLYSAASELARTMLEHFGAAPYDTREGMTLYDTADDVENLLLRPRQVQDSAVPSGNAMAATVLQTLTRLGDDPSFEDIARRSLAMMHASMSEYPLGFGQWLIALDSALAASVEVAIAGDPDAEETRALVRAARQAYAPHCLLAVGRGSVPELLAHRTQVDGRPTAYVCRNRICLPPVTSPEQLHKLLSA